MTSHYCTDRQLVKYCVYTHFISGELEFSHTLDLKNPWNDNKPVKISRDGQASV